METTPSLVELTWGMDCKRRVNIQVAKISGGDKGAEGTLVSRIALKDVHTLICGNC